MTDSLAFSKIEQFVVDGLPDRRFLDAVRAARRGRSAGRPASSTARRRARASRRPRTRPGSLSATSCCRRDGRYDVSEVFAEVNVPLLAERPFADKLSVDGAVRYSDYSTTGGATTWKAGLTWAPVYDLTLSATIAEATRAPNIGELFDPGGQTFQAIDDPCDISNLNEGTEFRAANCAALLTSLGVDPATYTDPNSVEHLRQPDGQSGSRRGSGGVLHRRPPVQPALGGGAAVPDRLLRHRAHRRDQHRERPGSRGELRRPADARQRLLRAADTPIPSDRRRRSTSCSSH